MIRSVEGCSHGMPSRASCILCMEEGPVAPPRPAPEQLLTADRWITAKYDGQCARKGCAVHEGDRIGVVANVGWCCEACAR